MRLLQWLCPDLLAEVDRLRWLTEANSDIHFLNLPFSPQIEDEAFQNARTFEPDIIAGKATLDDRLKSLIEVLTRKDIIKIKED
jgi:hypothetical protein